MKRSRLHVVAPGLAVGAMTVAALLAMAAPAAAAPSPGKVVLLSSMPGAAKSGYNHQYATEAPASLVYVYKYGTTNPFIDLWVCRTGGSDIDGADHAYGEVDEELGGRWTGLTWGDQYTVGDCQVFESPTLLNAGSLTLKVIVADNYHGTGKAENIAYLFW